MCGIESPPPKSISCSDPDVVVVVVVSTVIVPSWFADKAKFLALFSSIRICDEMSRELLENRQE